MKMTNLIIVFFLFIVSVVFPQPKLTQVYEKPPVGMVYVKGGTFQMGKNRGYSDENPMHTVTVSEYLWTKWK